MKQITELGWQAIRLGFAPFEPPIGDPVEFWEWASIQSMNTQKLAWCILALADAEGSDFEGRSKATWIDTSEHTSLQDLVMVLEQENNDAIAAFLSYHQIMVR